MAASTTKEVSPVQGSVLSLPPAATSAGNTRCCRRRAGFINMTLLFFVDDIQALLAGPGKSPGWELTMVAEELTVALEDELRLEVSKPKTVWLTTSESLATAVASASKRFCFQRASVTKSLGVGFSCGHLAKRMVQKARAASCRKRGGRFRMLGRAGVDVARLL